MCYDFYGSIFRNHGDSNVGANDALLKPKGEPGDAFHDRFVEGNYAYRAGLQFCHATVRLTDDVNCTSIFYNMCTGTYMDPSMSVVST